MSMPRLYIKNHTDLRQAMANIALSVAMEDAAATSLLKAERAKMALFGDPNSPLVQNTLNGDEPSLTLSDMAALDRSAADIVSKLNTFHQTLIRKYSIAAIAYLGRSINCEQPECAMPACPRCPSCPCDSQPMPDPPCPCDGIDADPPCECGD